MHFRSWALWALRANSQAFKTRVSIFNSLWEGSSTVERPPPNRVIAVQNPCAPTIEIKSNMRGMLAAFSASRSNFDLS